MKEAKVPSYLKDSLMLLKNWFKKLEEQKLMPLAQDH